MGLDARTLEDPERSCISEMKKLSHTLILVLFLISGCQREQSAVTNHNDNQEFPDQESWNSTLTTTNNGQVTAIIKYGHMRRFNKNQTVLFDEQIEIDFFDRNGNHSSRLTSNKGMMNEKENKVIAYENVVVVSDSGINLKTEKLWWDNAIEKVVTDRFITITTNKNDTLNGVGFESDQKLSNWMIKEVRGKTDKNIDLKFGKRKAHEN